MLSVKYENSVKYCALHTGDYFLYQNDPYIVTDRVQHESDDPTAINLITGRTHELVSDTIVKKINPTLVI